MDHAGEIIRRRHSTRSFDPDFEIDRETQEYILNAGCRAPSPKNRQPWQFVILTKKESLLRVSNILNDKITELKETRKQADLADDDLGMAQITARILPNVSMLAFVCYLRDETNEHHDRLDWRINAAGFEAADLQSIGACVENMLLAAEEKDISSLWICDVLYAHRELSDAFQMNAPFVSAVAFGKAMPSQTKRASLTEKAIWFDGSRTATQADRK